MKLDLKSSLIVVFFIGFVLFFAKWYLEGDSHRKENKKLKNDVEVMQHQRDSLKDERAKIESEIAELKKDLEKTKAQIVKLDAELAANKIDLKMAKDKLSTLQSNLNETRKKIQELKANPIKRTGSALLGSIKEKTK